MTAKKMGLKKGDWVTVEHGWYAKILLNVHTSTPMCYVFGWVHEVGSVHCSSLTKVNDVAAEALEQKYANELERFKTPLVLDK